MNSFHCKFGKGKKIRPNTNNPAWRDLVTRTPQWADCEKGYDESHPLLAEKHVIKYAKKDKDGNPILSDKSPVKFDGTGSSLRAPIPVVEWKGRKREDTIKPTAIFRKLQAEYEKVVKG
jgi:hypothetical protein